MKFTHYDLSLKDDVALFTKQLFYALFNDVCKEKANHLEQIFVKICKGLSIPKASNTWKNYQESFCEIRKKLDLDAQAFEKTDPACKSLEEVYLAYPGFHAIAVYRLSNALYKMKVPVIPRMMSEYAHSLTGTDIHPGASIGASFFIDHATGIVIGETTIINANVKIYQGVTLGGLQVKKELASIKRHPTIGSNVTIYANATILGGNVVIGKDSIIGANVCIVDTIPDGSVVTYDSENKIITRASYAK